MTRIFLSVVACTCLVSACGNKVEGPLVSEGPVLIETVPPIETEQTEAELRLALKNIEFEFNGFNPTDKSTWGEVAETNGKGRPTKYVRELQNGNTQMLVFHHGTKNNKFRASENIIGAEYIHWNNSGPTNPVVILDETRPVWKSMVEKYTRVWSVSPHINLVTRPVPIFFDEPRYSIKKCRKHNWGYITICDYDFRENPDVDYNHGGYTWLESDRSGHILSSVVHINTKDERLDENHPDNEDEALKHAEIIANRNFVVCHELGHAIGLDHFDSKHNKVSLGTCMDYSDNPWANLKPNAKDYAALASTYGHSHGEDQAAGVFCKAENEKVRRTYYLQRVSYNGVKAFAQTEIDIFKVNPKTQNARKVRFDTEDGELVEIRWSAPNKNNMKVHTDGREGEFPGLVSEEMRAKVTQRSKYKSVEEKLMTALQDGEVSGGPVGCTKLTEEQANDVSHFTPPKNGQGSGSYQRFQKKENLDGSRSDAPDVEKIYRYVDLGSEAQIIDDPVIEPFSAPEPAAR